VKSLIVTFPIQLGGFATLREAKSDFRTPMLAAKEKLAKSKTDAESNRLATHCAALDRQIDAAVYELYGLTEEEIAIVEGKEKS